MFHQISTQQQLETNNKNKPPVASFVSLTPSMRGALHAALHSALFPGWLRGRRVPERWSNRDYVIMYTPLCFVLLSSFTHFKTVLYICHECSDLTDHSGIDK